MVLIKQLLLTIFFCSLAPIKTLHGKVTDNNQKPFLWVYWENINGSTKMPGHISLCRKTLLKHCHKSFNIVELDEKNIYQYLPDLKQFEEKLDIKKLQIAHRVDFYRILLLHRYGGLYIDADMIVMKDLKEVADKLDKYDYVGFGHHNGKTVNEKNKITPKNWLMVSRSKGVFITSLLKNIITALQSKNELKYHSLGKYLIQKTLNNLLSKNYQYYHYSSDFDGTRDLHNNVISTEQIFSHEKIEYKNIDKLFVILLSNWHVDKMKTIKKMSEEEILSGNTNFAHFVKHSLSRT